MDRRKAIAVAGTVGVTLAAATAAVFANVSLLSSGDGGDDVGELDAQTVAELVQESPTTTPAPVVPDAGTPPTTVVYVDEYLTVPAGGPAAATPGAPAAGSAAAGDPAAGTPATAAGQAVPLPVPDPFGDDPMAPAAPSATDRSTTYGDDHAVGGQYEDDDQYEDEDHEDEDEHEEEYEDHEYEDDDD